MVSNIQGDANPQVHPLLTKSMELQPLARAQSKAQLPVNCIIFSAPSETGMVTLFSGSDMTQ